MLVIHRLVKEQSLPDSVAAQLTDLGTNVQIIKIGIRCSY
jgi:hypothetical protein